MKTLNFLILFFMTLIAACNSETAKLSEISKIQTTFNTGSTFYDGGVFVVGIRTDVPDKISYSSLTGSIPAITISRGDWTFYGLGYLGPQRMKGNLECGMTTVNIRGGDSVAVNLALSAGGCSGKLARAIKIHSVQVDACDGFYNYDLNNDQFSPATDYSAGTTCNYLPADQRAIGLSYYYRITFLNNNRGLESEGVTSSCRQNSAAADRIRLPIAVFPYKVKIYRTLDSCNAFMTPHNEFKMNDGLESGNAVEFDSFIKELQTDKTDTRIVVPSAHTKRYRSPFMSMIPRILCDGAQDCLSSPTIITPDPSPLPNAYLSHVQWNVPQKNQLLMQDVVSSSCTDMTHDSKYFGIKDCHIKNRFLYGTVVRNELACRPAASTENYKDIYERNGKVYLLYTIASTAYLKIFGEGGSLEHNLTLADNSYSQVAASDDEKIYLSSPISGTQGFRIDPSGSLSQIFDDSALIVSEMEVSPNGLMIYFADDPTNNFVRIYSTEDRVVNESITFSQKVRKIQYYGSEESLYVHIADSPNATSNSEVSKVRLARGNLMTPESVVTVKYSIGFHISKDILYLYGIGDGPGHVVSARKNNAGAWAIVNGLSSNSFLSTDADKFIAVDRGVYAIDTGTNTLVTNKFKFNGEWDNVFVAGICRDSFRIMLGNQTQSFTAISEEGPSNISRNHILFDAGLSSVGIRLNFQEFNRYAFNSLNKNQTKETLTGKLSLVQRLLGPQGVGGMLSEYSSCDVIKTLAGVSSIEKIFPVSDPYSGYKSFTVRISSTSTVIPSFICDDNLINNTGCSENYDLTVSVRSTGLTESENYKLRLKCNSKKGEIDYYRFARGETDKQVHYWNTTDEGSSRSDSYELYSFNDEFRASMTYLTKSNDSNLRSRSVVLEEWDDLRTSYTMDYERDDLDHKVYQLSYSAKPSAFSSLAGYGANRNTDQFSGTALVCKPINQTQLNSANTSCSMNGHSSVNSKGLPLSMATLENAATPGVTFQNLFQMSP